MFLGEISTKNLMTLFVQLSRVELDASTDGGSLILAIREVESELQRRGVDVWS